MAPNYLFNFHRKRVIDLCKLIIQDGVKLDRTFRRRVRENSSTGQPHVLFDSQIYLQGVVTNGDAEGIASQGRHCATHDI
jgi:hypothetical protein